MGGGYWLLPHGGTPVAAGLIPQNSSLKGNQLDRGEMLVLACGG